MKKAWLAPDHSQAGLESYMKTVLRVSGTANTKLTYDYNVNGDSGFMIDDISVAYDFTRLQTLSWTAADEYLIISDLSGDSVLNQNDVSMFVGAYNGTN